MHHFVTGIVGLANCAYLFIKTAVMSMIFQLLSFKFDLSSCCVMVTITYSQSDLIKCGKCLWFVK
jgi:hypothetical protein